MNLSARGNPRGTKEKKLSLFHIFLYELLPEGAAHIWNRPSYSVIAIKTTPKDRSTGQLCVCMQSFTKTLYSSDWKLHHLKIKSNHLVCLYHKKFLSSATVSYHLNISLILYSSPTS